MKRNLLLSLVFMLTVMSAFSQNPMWIKTSADRLSGLEKTDRNTVPKQYQLFQLDYEGIKSQLAAAPSRNTEGLLSPTILTFPNAQGKLEKYRIYESSVMEAELAVQHPEIQSYVGVGIDNPKSKIHLTTTIFGLHGMVLSNKETFYIDPYTKDLKNYIVYNKASLSTTKVFECKSADFSSEGLALPVAPPTTFANDGLFRTYRLAMACTIEYAAYHVNAAGLSGGTLTQKKNAVLAAMNVTVARVNSVYENDMSLKMVLVASNTNIIFIDSDTFTNEDDGALINEGATVINSTIGTANYDIGHTVSTSGSGLAQLGAVCTSNKARGTTGSSAPVGDPFDIDYVAHEMGHQFGAHHTQNNDCNKSFDYSVEPGSGSTIMGYAGICPPNVQSNSDTYFHAVSIANMVAHISGSGNCVTGVPSGNIAAVVTPLMNRTIPIGTAFVLKGAATGPAGAELEYCWEQTNNGGNNSSVPAPGVSASIPNFRSLPPSESPNRYMPALSTVLNGSLASTWEVIPNVARTMNFALTVRNNTLPDGGQTSRQNMTVNFSAAAGPFTVTSQNTDNISWNQGETHNITWNVANTNAAPVSTANVNILLSTDGGLTYDTVLVANTPNDGSQSITVPNVAAPFCRIMVEAVGNIFYALNPKTFSIGYTVTTQCNTYSSTTAVAIPDGTGPNVGGPLAISNIAIADTALITDVNVTVNVTHAYIQDLVAALDHPDDTQVFLLSRICDNENGFNITFSDGAGAIACAAPITTGTFSPEVPLANLNTKPANGQWTLLLQDQYNGDTGTLNSWSIEICSQEIVLNTEDFSIKNLIVSPNPNKGNFKIQFDSVSGSDINVGVYDIGGRQIFNHNYSNTGLFSQDIQLGNVQSGIYLVNIQDGDKTETRKIIVE